jgi:hypothetical protein
VLVFKQQPVQQYCKASIKHKIISRLQVSSFWNDVCRYKDVLRITVIPNETVGLKLEGRLVGPWVDELKNTVRRMNDWRKPLEIDVADLTFADEDGENVLAWLHGMGAHFKGKGPFSGYLLERLKIPLFSMDSISDKRDEGLQH